MIKVNRTKIHDEIDRKKMLVTMHMAMVDKLTSDMEKDVIKHNGHSLYQSHVKKNYNIEIIQVKQKLKNTLDEINQLNEFLSTNGGRYPNRREYANL